LPFNLFEVFHAAEVEEAELAHVLLSHFQTATQINLRETTYPGHQTDYALKLTYGKKSELIQIAPGPRLSDRDVATIQRRVENELLTSTGTQVGREVFFAHMPVKGYFRYRDRFQIRPMPDGSPQPDSPDAEHPFLLEYQFPTSTSSMIQHMRRRVRARELHLVLAGLLEGSIRWLDGTFRHHWVLLPPPPEDEWMWKTAYRQEMYIWSQTDPDANNFSSTDHLPRLTEVDPQTYYTRSGIGPDVMVPSSFETLLDRYYVLAKPDRERFLRACYWFQHSWIVHSYSRSASFTALMCAVEALILPETGAALCPTCRRPQNKGPTRLFAEFVDRFAPGDSISKADRRQFYKIRSRLSHGGGLLSSDMEWFRPLHRAAEEWGNSYAAWHLVRTVLVNWLQAQQPAHGS
jgi:hypothetical protein